MDRHAASQLPWWHDAIRTGAWLLLVIAPVVLLATIGREDACDSDMYECDLSGLASLVSVVLGLMIAAVGIGAAELGLWLSRAHRRPPAGSTR